MATQLVLMKNLEKKGDGESQRSQGAIRECETKIN